MLTEVSLHEYRAHTATRIPLQQLTVLIGPNAAGKSSVLEAVQLLGRLIDAGGSQESVLFGEHDLRWLVRRGATEPMSIEVAGRRQGAPARRIWFRTSDRFIEIESDEPDELDDDEEPDELDANESVFPRESDLGRVLRSAATLRLDSRRLSEPSISAEEVPSLQEDGYGLATVLSVMKLTSTARFKELEAAACRIVPTLRGIGFKRTRIERLVPRTIKVEGQMVIAQEKTVAVADELVLDFVDAEGLPAHAASEGTMIVLGILATLYGPAAPRLLLLDDIERALHPKAQQDLIRMLHAALATAPEAQIIATSHSPYLVDALGPDEVVVLGRGADGRVAARRLSEHPKAKALEVLTSGELWTAEGEGWVAGA
ncbi:AAA family ATPase [Sorangium sp. So ce406]|uniref:AAA family ATPase n=1 Tax=Sorangium sp. So ce406 TaxID=3133311 RepID=UPI003F5CAC26